MMIDSKSAPASSSSAVVQAKIVIARQRPPSSSRLGCSHTKRRTQCSWLRGGGRDPDLQPDASVVQLDRI
jgi:hypothetical protein